jgi:hypothetical protein
MTPRLASLNASGALATSSALATFAALAVCAPTTASAAPTSAMLSASLSPDRPLARGRLSVTIHYAGGEFGLPAPVRRTVLRFPAGLSIAIPLLRSCSPTRLRARGPSACPRQSRLGGGSALVETHPASQTISEHVALSAFVGPPRRLQPTVELLGQGQTPLDLRLVVGGTVQAGPPPYGEQLVLNIPPIPTLALEPDASLAELSLTVGAGPGAEERANAIVMPRHCPAGGFPFAGEFTYADGSTGTATTTVPCPA